jgi:hypothetical protein
LRILFIHGRAQGGKDPAELRQTWINTLNKGVKAAGLRLPDDVQFDFPFYADTLDDFVARLDDPQPDTVVAKGPGETTPLDNFIAQALVGIADDAEIRDAEVHTLVEGPPVTEKGPQNWRWVRALARAVDRRFTPGAEWTIKRFLTDVHLYIDDARIRREINAIVAEALTDEPTVVVGHSLGSLVGYRFLSELEDSDNILRFITVGSPLGVRAIATRLGVPQHVGNPTWFNAFDPQDIVALNPLDNDRFPTHPAIQNHDRVQNSTDNHHGIVGYLDDPEVARAVVKGLQG